MQTRHIVQEDNRKQCLGCGALLPYTIEYFTPKKSNKSGLSARCKACHAAETRKWYAKNPEQRKAITQAYKERDPERYKAMRKRSHKRHAEKEREYVRTHRQQQREYVRKYQTKHPPDDETRRKDRERYARNPTGKIASASRWQKTNPEKKRAINHNRRTRLVSNGGSYTQDEWIALCQRYDNKCLRCGATDKPLTVDHVTPISRGGTNDISNIQPLCFSCNSSKGNKIIDYR